MTKEVVLNSARDVVDNALSGREEVSSKTDSGKQRTDLVRDMEVRRSLSHYHQLLLIKICFSDACAVVLLRLHEPGFRADDQGHVVRILAIRIEVRLDNLSDHQNYCRHKIQPYPAGLLAQLLVFCEKMFLVHRKIVIVEG